MRESCDIAGKGVGEAGKSSDRVVLEWKRVKSDRAHLQVVAVNRIVGELGRGYRWHTVTQRPKRIGPK